LLSAGARGINDYIAVPLSCLWCKTILKQLYISYSKLINKNWPNLFVLMRMFS